MEAALQNRLVITHHFASTTQPPSLPPPPPGIGYEAVIGGGLTLMVGCTVGLVKWLLSREVASVESKLQRVSTQNERLRDDLSNLREEINRGFVTREEYLRHMTVSEAKLDAVHRRLDEIINRLFSGGK